MFGVIRFVLPQVALGDFTRVCGGVPSPPCAQGFPRTLALTVTDVLCREYIGSL